MLFHTLDLDGIDSFKKKEEVNVLTKGDIIVGQHEGENLVYKVGTVGDIYPTNIWETYFNSELDNRNLVDLRRVKFQVFDEFGKNKVAFLCDGKELEMEYNRSDLNPSINQMFLVDSNLYKVAKRNKNKEQEFGNKTKVYDVEVVPTTKVEYLYRVNTDFTTDYSEYLKMLVSQKEVK